MLFFLISCFLVLILLHAALQPVIHRHSHPGSCICTCTSGCYHIRIVSGYSYLAVITCVSVPTILIFLFAASSSYLKSAFTRINGTLNAEGYINEILTTQVLPIMQAHGAVLQNDNADCIQQRQHSLHAYDVDIHDWPSWWPDLDPIEHFWDELESVCPYVPRQTFLSL